VISSISEVAGYDHREQRIRIEDIFRFERLGVEPSGRVIGEFRMTGHLPSFLAEFKTLGLLDSGPYL